jgi:glutamate/tyrosine decarboxylase-like PLP-dependent enzyme
MEREVIDQLGQMLGYRQPFLGHLSASGTIANLEALWIARCTHAGKAIAIGDQAHYTHGRACELLNVDVVTLPTDADGRLIVSEVQRALAGGGIGTIVVTAGTTALGMVDPIHEIIPLARAAGVRVHVDAAYGGFFTLLAHRDDPPIHAAPFLAIADADSIVVDPHKHGLQPYGCGAVLFRDPNAGRFYAHDSPYTYFTSADLHLGEITLECSRAGASAAALWATLRCLPLVPDRGLGAVLDKTRQAALAWSGAINAEPRLRLLAQPDLDIIGFFAMPNDTSTPHAGAISRLTQHIFDSTMNDPADPVYLAKLMVTRAQIGDRFPEITWDEPRMEVIRSVLMKPEHLSQVPALHQRVMRAVAEAG